MFLKEPARHGLQATPPSALAENEPRLHMQLPMLTLPCGDMVKFGHGRQVELVMADTFEEYVLLGQLVHDSFPTASLYLPGLHAAHESRASPGENPGRQAQPFMDPMPAADSDVEPSGHA